MDSRPIIAVSVIAIFSAIAVSGNKRVIMGKLTDKAKGIGSFINEPGITPKPSLDSVIAAFNHYGYPLPGIGERVIVSCIYRNTPSNKEPYDPWDDWVGVLWNDGEYGIEFFQGTAEPGAKPMYRKGNIPTHKDGVVRTVAPQYSTGVYGGGYHNHNTDTPALRHVGKMLVQRFNDKTEKWGDVFSGTFGMNLHTTSSPQSRGVGDWSHGCTVIRDANDHARLLSLAGWTPAIDGVSLPLAAFLIDSNGSIIYG